MSPTPRSPLRSRLPRLTATDLRGLSQLAVDGLVGVTDVIEAMHHAIGSRAVLRRPGSEGRTSGLTGFVYRAVRGTMQLSGLGLQTALRLLARPGAASSPAREAWISAVNGIWGDHLADTGNPLAIGMSLRSGGRPWEAGYLRPPEPAESVPGAAPRTSLQAPPPAPSHATGRLLVLVHGLVMNDLQWTRHGQNHGQRLADELGFTPLYLHYNSGRHISQNGRDLADLLDTLVERWPVPVQELVLVGHSMGGLVIRSACAQAEGRRWRTLLGKLVFLGSPHHGAALERGGRLLGVLLEASPFAAPLARLGKSRSAGITDLRFGNLHDADWSMRDRHAQRRDDRVPTPLPAGVPCYVIAATRSPRADAVPPPVPDASVPDASLTQAPDTHALQQASGDGLVSLASALGRHADARLALQLPPAHQQVLHGAGHWDLLDRAEVGDQLCRWLA